MFIIRFISLPLHHSTCGGVDASLTATVSLFQYNYMYIMQKSRWKMLAIHIQILYTAQASKCCETRKKYLKIDLDFKIWSFRVFVLLSLHMRVEKMEKDVRTPSIVLKLQKGEKYIFQLGFNSRLNPTTKRFSFLFLIWLMKVNNIINQGDL